MTKKPNNKPESKIYVFKSNAILTSCPIIAKSEEEAYKKYLQIFDKYVRTKPHYIRLEQLEIISDQINP